MLPGTLPGAEAFPLERSEGCSEPLPDGAIWCAAPAAALRDYRPGAPALEGRFLWDYERLYARIAGPAHGVLTLYLDPVGDREAYFEFGADLSGRLLTRTARRGRTGTKFDRSWDCPGAIATLEPSAGCVAARIFSIPFAGLGSRSPDEAAWLIGAAVNADFEELRPAPLLIPLRFCREFASGVSLN